MRAVLSLLLAVPVAHALSPIHTAIEANDPTAVRAALSDGADIDESGDEGETPLMAAVRADKLRAAAALMKMGADATVRGADGLTPLHVAAHRGNGKIVRMLLRYDADARDIHSDGLTPFHRACAGAEAGHTDAVFAFLDTGIEADLRTADGRQPMELSSKNANTRKLLAEALQEKRQRQRQPATWF